MGQSGNRGQPRLRLLSSLEDAQDEMRKIGADPAGIRIMAPKAVHHAVRIDHVSIPAAQVLKEEMLSIGGEVVRAKGAVNYSIPSTDLLLLGSLRHYRRLIRKLRAQPFGLKALSAELEELLNAAARTDWPPLRCGRHLLVLGGRTLVMGILNVTPDSFSGDGIMAGEGGGYVAAAIARARQMVADGADIIDVGAESTRPGAEPVSAREEIDRLVPVIKAITSELDVPVSVDTYKAETAAAAIGAGATLVNDISGLKLDPKMADIVAEHDVPLVVMHMKGTPRTMQNEPRYSDVMGEVIDGLRESIGLATAAGLSADQIVVDPGIGFGKTFEHNLELLERLPELKSLGRPILVGTSRKAFIGHTLGGLPPDQRQEGTAATVALSIAGGAQIVRVHDVRQMSRVARMSDAVCRRRRNAEQQSEQ